MADVLSDEDLRRLRDSNTHINPSLARELAIELIALRSHSRASSVKALEWEDCDELGLCADTPIGRYWMEPDDLASTSWQLRFVTIQHEEETTLLLARGQVSAFATQAFAQSHFNTSIQSCLIAEGVEGKALAEWGDTIASYDEGYQSGVRASAALFENDPTDDALTDYERLCNEGRRQNILSLSALDGAGEQPPDEAMRLKAEVAKWMKEFDEKHALMLRYKGDATDALALYNQEVEDHAKLEASLIRLSDQDRQLLRMVAPFVDERSREPGDAWNEATAILWLLIDTTGPIKAFRPEAISQAQGEGV